MAKSIRISDHLYEQASAAAGFLDRSIAQQIEHWVSLDRPYP